MTRFATTITLMAGTLTLAVAQAVDLAKDERLAKPVTVRLKMAILPEAMAALTKAGGVPLEAATSIKDWKVTVLVKDQPAWAVMSKIASTLDLEWEADGSTYRIKSNADVANAERKYVDQEDRLRQKGVTETLQRMAGVASVPWEQAKAKDAQLTPERYLLGQLFRGMAANQWNGFWNGRTVRTAAPLRGEAAAEALADQGNPRQGPPRQQTQDRRSGEPPARNFRVVRVAAQYDPISNQLTTSYEQRAMRGDGRLIHEPYPQGELAETTFGKRVTAWESRDDKSEALQKPLTAVAPKSDGWFAGWFSAADALESLHLASGIPIVADAFRVSVRPITNAATPAAWLASYRQANPSYVKTEDGFAMIRHGGFWRLRRLDAPERLARALEKAKGPALEDYAAYVAALTPAQGLAYRTPGAALLRVNPESLRTGLTALRFYASLGALQRQARMNQAIPFGAMGAAQQELFMEALDGTFEGGTTVGRGAMIDVQQEANALAFLLSLEEVPNQAEGGALQSGTRMLFGVGANDGVTYQLPAAPRP